MDTDNIVLAQRVSVEEKKKKNTKKSSTKIGAKIGLFSGEGGFRSKSLQNPSFARIYLPRWTSTAQLQRSKVWGSVLGRDRVARATLFSPSENRCLSASTLKSEDREFVVDSGASMHLISKKDLSDAETDTWTKSRSPTIVITAMEKCRGMKRQRWMSKNWIFSWLWKSSKTRQQYCRSESFAMKMDILTNGSMVKNHILLKTGFGLSAIRRTSFLLWFQAYQRVRLQDLIRQLQGHFQDRRVIIQHLLQACLHQLQQVILRLENERIELKVTSLQWLCQLRLMKDRRDPMLTKPIKLQKLKKKSQKERRDPLYSEIPERLQEFRENFVENEIPEHVDSHASSSHEASLEPTFKTDVRICVNTVFILISLKTEIARSARGQKLQGLRAGDAMVEPYLVLKILVTWLQQITKSSVTIAKLETITDMQSRCRT